MLIKEIIKSYSREKLERIFLFQLKGCPLFFIFNVLKITRKMQMLKLAEKIRECKKCSLYKSRINAVPGEGPEDAVIMFCGQAPGRTEDKDGRPFVGMAGKCLDFLLKSIKLCREKIFITSSIKCFPPNNRPPKLDEIRECKIYLMEQIKIVNPKIIVALGNYALRTLLDNISLLL